MKISELAQLTGVSVHALRHYEVLGMIIPSRSPNGYREYADSTRREVIFIAMSRTIGFSLKAIAEQLPAYRAGHLSIDEMVGSMHSRVKEIDSQIENLVKQRVQVVSHIAWLEEKQRNYQTLKTSTPPTKAAWPTVKKSSRIYHTQPERK